MKAQIDTQSDYERVMDSIDNADQKMFTSPVPGYKGMAHKTVRCLNRNPYTLATYPFGSHFIGEILNTGQVSRFLRMKSAMFIDAQTGAGKTSFVFNILYQLLHEQGKRLLYLGSRSALKEKARYDAIKAAGTDHLERFTTLGLRQKHRFGDIDVFSYQELFHEDVKLARKNRDLLKRQLPTYGAAIFDEAHFFIADADFNAYSGEALISLVRQFVDYEVPRIYLTGTPDDVFDSIWKVEWTAQLDHDRFNHFRPPRPYDEYYSMPILHHFYFRRDYHYLNFFVLNKEEIENKIQNSNEKWIIFVESKQYGERLAGRLEKHRTVLSLDSSTLHDKGNNAVQQFLQRLTQDEELDADILITTKCLDVGVTIKTRNVNLACFLTDKVDFLQSIGRKRVSEKESVNLFVPRYSIKDVNHWLVQTRNTLHEYAILQQTCKKGELANGCAFPCPIYIRDGRYRFNDLAVIKLRNRQKRLEALLDEIAQSNESDEVVISRHFAAWLGKETPLNGLGSDSDTKKNELAAIVSPYLGVTMDEAQYSSFCEALKPFDPRTDVRASRAEITTQTVNKILLPLALSIKRSKRGNQAIFQIIEKEG